MSQFLDGVPLPVWIAIWVALTGVLGYLAKRSYEYNDREQLRLSRRVEIYAQLSSLPPEQVEQFEAEIEAVYGKSGSVRSLPRNFDNVIMGALAASPEFLRSEGLAEKIGSIRLQFATESHQELVSVDVEVKLNAQISNELRGNSFADATLLVGGDSVGIRGQPSQWDPRKVLFKNVGVPFAPGTDSVSCLIENLRVNAASVGAGGEVVAFVSVRPSAPGVGPRVLITNDLISVGLVYQGLVTSVSGPGGRRSPKLFGYGNESLLSEAPRGQARLNFLINLEEGFKGAFKIRAQEAGSVANYGEATVVTNGSRFLVRFLGVPKGTKLFVTASEAWPLPFEGSPSAVIVPDADENGAGGRPFEDLRDLSGPTTEAGIKLHNVRLDGDGNGFAVWEWVQEGPVRYWDSPGASRENTLKNLWHVEGRQINLGVAVAGRFGDTEVGVGQVSTTWAPLSDVSGQVTAPVPRFVDTGGDPYSAIFFPSENMSLTLEDQPLYRVPTDGNNP